MCGGGGGRGGEGGGGWGIEKRVSHHGLGGVHENSRFICTKTIDACDSSSIVVHKHDKLGPL